MPARGVLTDEYADLIQLVRTTGLLPRAGDAERTQPFPREVFRIPGRARSSGSLTPRSTA